MAGMVAGKVAIVTGAGRGIGRAIALDLAANGARVVVNDIGGSLAGEGLDDAPAQEVVDAVRAAGGEAITSAASVSDWAGAQAIVASAVERFGRVDIVVNNAGILRDSIFHRMTPEDFDAVLRVHLYGSYHMCRAAAPHFIAQHGGAFVHMTSTAGLIGSMGQANYAAAKLGIAGLSRAISFDLEAHGVRSNCVAPGAFSRMIESVPGASPEQQAAYLAKRAATMRPEQGAPRVTFLASDAADGVTGQIIGARGNELYLYSQPRPVRTMEREGGWRPQAIADELLPAWSHSFVPADRTRNIFPWDPV